MVSTILTTGLWFLDCNGAAKSHLLSRFCPGKFPLQLHSVAGRKMSTAPDVLFLLLSVIVEPSGHLLLTSPTLLLVFHGLLNMTHSVPLQ